MTISWAQVEAQRGRVFWSWTLTKRDIVFPQIIRISQETGAPILGSAKSIYLSPCCGTVGSVSRAWGSCLVLKLTEQSTRRTSAKTRLGIPIVNRHCVSFVLIPCITVFYLFFSLFCRKLNSMKIQLRLTARPPLSMFIVNWRTEVTNNSSVNILRMFFGLSRICPTVSESCRPYVNLGMSVTSKKKRGRRV